VEVNGSGKTLAYFDIATFTAEKSFTVGGPRRSID